MKTWITADWHLGENRMAIMGRPFDDPDQMVNALIANHNALVKPEDTVYMVGDVCYQKAPEYRPYVQRFNGKKILFRGNHDRVFTDGQLEPYFAEIFPEGEGTNVLVGNRMCFITHYPTCGVIDRFNLVGHIHAAWKYQLNMLNVGVDVHHFRPMDLDTLTFHYEAATKFYDQDVWVAYNQINSTYVGQRGKAGTYFTKSA